LITNLGSAEASSARCSDAETLATETPLMGWDKALLQRCLPESLHHHLSVPQIASADHCHHLIVNRHHTEFLGRVFDKERLIQSPDQLVPWPQTMVRVPNLNHIPERPS
jgi:hypothetical protein